MPTSTAIPANNRPPAPAAKEFRFPEGVTVRERPLGFRWRANYDTLNELIGLPPCASKKMERVMASIVVDVIKAGPFERTSYSRSRGFYDVPARYRATDYGYETVVGAVDRLVAAGVLVEHRKQPQATYATGWQSSFIGSPELYWVADLPAFERGKTDAIKLKDKTGKLIDYPETRRTSADRKITAAINARIRNAAIALTAPTIADQNANAIRFLTDDDHGPHTVYTDKTELYRVYNGAWTLGGRYYGGWWQNVRSDDRKHFTIDGEATVEEDYPQLHPRLLYAHAGQQLDGDAYEIAGWDRKLCKRAFNVLVNAGNFFEAKAAVAAYAGDDRSALALIEAIKIRHFRIRKLFHSGMGLRLQNLDSEMAKTVLTEMTLGNGIVVLPIHDSFIVPVTHHDLLKSVMHDAFEKVVHRHLEAHKLDGVTSADEDPAEIALVGGAQSIEGNSAETSHRRKGAAPVDAPTSGGRGSSASLAPPPADGSDGSVVALTLIDPSPSIVPDGDGSITSAPTISGDGSEAFVASLSRPIPSTDPARPRPTRRVFHPPKWLGR
jgi:hypothetical protein